MILDIYAQATPKELERGMRWYEDAHKWAGEVADKYGVGIETVAAVTAALSPANKWPRNKEDTEKLLAAYTSGKEPWDVSVCTYNKNKARAIKAIKEGMEAISGPKTKNFGLNILEPDGDHPVVIDRHAYNITQGERIIINKSGTKVTPGRYKKAAAKYRHIAEELGIRPNQLQAVTWVVWRRLIGENKYD